jgi:O-antigen ligase
MELKILKPYLLHIIIGMIAVSFPNAIFLLTIGIPIIGVYHIIKTHNTNNEALMVCCYVAGVEILLRMTNTMFFYEYAKYSIMIYLLIGMYFSSFSNYAFIYVFIAFLYFIGVFYGAFNLDFNRDIRKAIAFNISGPMTLVVTAIYCYKREASLDHLKQMLYILSLPVLSIVTLIIIKAPTVRDFITGTQSNFETSGGFGPNQVATILGLGAFCTFALFVVFSKNIKQSIIFLALTAVFTYRGIVTFSRGGMMTSLVMAVLLLVTLFFYASKENKSKLLLIAGMSVVAIVAIWLYSSSQTDGMIEKRYRNQDGLGREKKETLGGREELAKHELQMFYDNPIFGVGVGRNEDFRFKMTGQRASTHNEITRLLAEHGSVGIFALIMIIILPFVNRANNPYHFFFFPFLIFWFLTIQHSAMRTAMPGFIYGLTLLKVIPYFSKNDENVET